ncbi:MAG: PilZ domain-containing protein [Candidatus Omnitrophica bacterium]|nr:PilZ domain-containing protein [Candidatus Omnitrophota bacterium]
MFKKYKKERRRFLRLSVHHLLKYKIIKKPEDIKVLSFVRNISACGVLFYTQEYIPLNSIIEIEIFFPQDEKAIKLLSKVVRVNFLPKVGGFSIGAEFINIDKDTQEIINSKILNVYKQQKEKGGKMLRIFSIILIILALLAAIAGFCIKLMGIYIFIAPMNWIHIVNMLLLFSIAFSLLVIAKK